MKIVIGNYTSRLRCSIHDRYMDNKYGLFDWPKEYTRFESTLEWIEERVQDFYNIFNRIWFDRRTQKVKVRIDHWDTWSMDHTLAPIILPMLIQLKKTKHGSPDVDDKDVPKELHKTPTKNKWDIDDNWHKRWDWVMDEMIYAFDCKANKDDVYMRFDSKSEQEKEQDRISNGFRLFGKYYENLWD